MPPGIRPSASEIEKKAIQKQNVLRFLTRQRNKATRSDERAKLTQQIKRVQIEIGDLKTALCNERHGTVPRETRASNRKHVFYL